MRASFRGALAVLVAATAAPAATLHVCPDGSGEYPNLSAAVAAAVSGDEIELCDGVFTGLENVEVDVGSKSLTFRSLHGMDATTIDASIPGGEFDEYFPYVAFILGPGSSTRIEGISIVRAGHLNSQTWEYGDGGAIECHGSSLVLDGVRIDGRFPLGAIRGAGVFVESGGLSAYDCVFTGNRADYGAAVHAGGPATLARCTFVGNGTCLGSVAELRAGGLVEDCVFQSCGGAATACGSESDPGGRALGISGPAATVVRTSFIDNHSASGGTGISSGADDLLVEDCSFEDCTSSYGSGSGITRGTLRRCRFLRHHAANSGGTVWCGAGPVLFENCVFLAARNAVGSGTTWATVAVSGSATLQACTFAGTTCGADVRLEVGASVTLDRTIVAFAEGSSVRVVCADPSATITAACTDVFGNDGGDWAGCIAGMQGEAGNLAADPLFCGLAVEDLSIRSTSPCAPGQSACGLIGALPVGCGITALTRATWGEIKGQFR